MLEEILKNINDNLEKIANAVSGELEGKIITKLEENPTGVTITKQAQVIPAQTIPTQNILITQPELEQQIPTPQPVIPTTVVQESFTQEQLARAMANAVSAGKMNVIQGILQQFNVQALTQINPTDYNKVATMLKEAGVAL